MKICSIEGCERAVKSKGYCNAHYIRVRKFGDPSKVGRPKQKCIVDGCELPHWAKGYCRVHYKRFKRHGDPLAEGRTYDGNIQRWLLEHLEYSGAGCLIWPYARASAGYGQIRIDGKTENVHVIMCTISHGPRPGPKHEVLHSCGNGHLGCVNPMHLRWGTSQENADDSLVHGTRAFGERHGNSKLKESDVIEIRRMIRNGVAREEIARIFGCHRVTIRSIENGRNWSWLQDSAGAP